MRCDSADEPAGGGNSPLLNRLPDAERERLLAEARRVRLATGTILVQQDDPAPELFIVESGHLRLTLRSGSGGESTVDIVGAGDTVCETAILGGEPAPVTAQAIEETSVLAVDGARLRQELLARFDLMMGMLGDMSARLRGLLGQLTDLKSKSTAQRLGMFLLSLCATSCGAADVTLPYGKRVVAEKLGMKPETLSRAFARLRPLGVRGGPAETTVHIDDVAELAEYCGVVLDDDREA